MGTVTRRRDGSYCATLQLAGRRRFVYGRSPAEVRAKLQALAATVAQTGRLPTPGQRTLNDLLTQWLQTAALRPKTLAGYQDLLDRHVRPTLGALRLRQLDPSHLASLYAALRQRGLRREPWRVHRLLHRACAVGVRWGWLASNPAAAVEAPPYQPPRRAAWTLAGVRTFLADTQGHRLGPLWAFLLTTGCRLGEALALRWSDVNLDQGTVHLQRTGTYLGGRWVEGPPKTRAGERVVHLPPEGVQALRRQRAQQAQWRLRAGATWQAGDYVFTTSQGRPVRGNVAARELREACIRLGLVPQTPHGLRHAHASLLLAQGVALPAVARRLGHAHPGITAAVYAHALPGQDRQVAETLGRVLAGR